MSITTAIERKKRLYESGVQEVLGKLAAAVQDDIKRVEAGRRPQLSFADMVATLRRDQARIDLLLDLLDEED